LNLLKDTGENTSNFFISYKKKEKIVLAFTKVKNKYRKSLSNLVSFKDLVLSDNLRKAWVLPKKVSLVCFFGKQPMGD
jgi:hypothetical protein